jgi:16S rRNA (uracil1498-N3)-methyltransferase
MKIHRFYIDPKIELKHDFWLHDKNILHQWRNVLRFKQGQQVVLFDGVMHERLYTIDVLKEDEAHLQLVTDFERQVPQKDLYVLWSLLKKDNNDWILQKATELGANHFLPLLAQRSEKTGFNVERAHKIVTEAAEQCGRGNIPAVREPVLVETAIRELHDKVQLFVCEQGASHGLPATTDNGPRGVLVGPEGGWDDAEKQLFDSSGLSNISLSGFTLRAETAVVTAAAIMMQG